MGAWGTGSFDNDDALDWAFGLEDADGDELLQAAFEATSGDEDLESPDCCVALAAAEIVAAWLGEPVDTLPAEIVDWIGGQEEPPDDDLVIHARDAVGRVGAKSELRELWEDTEDYQAWDGGLEDLLSRLGGG